MSIQELINQAEALKILPEKTNCSFIPENHRSFICEYLLAIDEY